ncbi:MAG: hypothetical protein AVDCRST_MAG35-1955, partial [uncultured Quadrisphaera sp.]
TGTTSADLRHGPEPAPGSRAADRAPGRVLTGTLLASSTLTITAAAIISPSLPEMARVFSGVPAADLLVRLSLTITSLTIGLTAAVAGVVTDRVGRKPVLVASLVLYAVAGTAGWFVSDLHLLLGARALLGVAVGGVTTSVSALISDWFDGERRGAVIGQQAAFASLGGVVFIPVAGVLAGIAWDAPFWLYASSLLVVPFAVLGVREARPRSSGPEPVAPGTGGSGPRSPAGRALALPYAVAAGATLVFFMTPTQLPFLLQRFDASPAAVGVAVAAGTASSTVAALAYSRVRRQLSQELVTAVSIGLLGAGWLVIGLAGGLPLVLVGALVGGLGLGLIVPTLNQWVAGLVPAPRRGRALGGLVSAIFLGQSASPLVLQPVVDAVGTSTAFLLTGAAAGAGAVALAVVLPRRARRVGTGTSA